MSNFKQIESLIAVAKEEGTKFFEQKNNLAGTRYREALKNIKALAQEERNNVTLERKVRESAKSNA
jgi:hypothetical protein